MANERELKIQLETHLFDILRLVNADEGEKEMLLFNMLERAQCGLTNDEVDAVKERVARAKRGSR
jgi:hypothetical protein